MNIQYRGYILLLTMIILSSIILLLFTVINTNRLAEGFSSTMLNKQEEYLLLQSGIAITQSLISSQKEKSEDKKEEKTVKEQEKTKESEDLAPIRTYDLCRSHGVPDRVTDTVDGDVRRVLDGRLDPFLEAHADTRTS